MASHSSFPRAGRFGNLDCGFSVSLLYAMNYQFYGCRSISVPTDLTTHCPLFTYGGYTQEKRIKFPSLRKQVLQKDSWCIIPTENTTNEYIWQQVNVLAIHQENFLSTIERCKLSWFGRVCRLDTLLNTILHVKRWKVVVTDEDLEGQHERMDRPVTVVADAHRRRQKQMGSCHHTITNVCRNASNDTQVSVEFSFASS